jgi:threonine dehydratase
VGVAALATQAGQAALARAGAGSDADVVVVVTGRNVDAARAAKVVLRQPVR